jgi:hypothetical protein
VLYATKTLRSEAKQNRVFAMHETLD